MRIGDTRWDVLEGDIIACDVDAIVNAANSSLLGGGGLDGAIHRAAGPDLVFECRLLGGCKTGQAKLTRGYRLNARHIIHTVGPVWRGGNDEERDLLASCYDQSLSLARKHGLRTVAFPAISTGIYRFPMEEAAGIAATTVAARLSRDPGSFDRIVFVCYSADSTRIYRSAVERAVFEAVD